jgi:hypothetical protein
MSRLDPELIAVIDTVGARRRKRIIAAGVELAGDIRADADALATAPVGGGEGVLRVLDLLPAQTFTQSKLWRYQLAAAAEVLAEDTRRWGAPLPRSTGEEMALHLILRRAAAADGCPPNRVEDWPGEPHRPGDGWGDLFECLFQDHDVLMLYDLPKADMDDLRCVNIDPQRWFSPFELPFPTPPRR